MNELEELSVEAGDLYSVGQGVLLDSIKKFDLRRKIKFNTYLISIIKFRVIDELRKLKRDRMVKIDHIHETQGVECNQLKAIEDDDLIDGINKLVLRMDPLERAVLLNKYYGGRHEDLAGQLGCSIARVSQIYTKAINNLKQGIKDGLE